METFRAYIDNAVLADALRAGDVLYLGERGDIGRDFQATRELFLSAEPLDGDYTDLHHMTWVSEGVVEYACGKVRAVSAPSTVNGRISVKVEQVADDTPQSLLEADYEEQGEQGLYVPVLRHVMAA